MSQGRQVVLNYSKAAEKIKIFKQSGKREWKFALIFIWKEV
jgi:hypothetical protein